MSAAAASGRADELAVREVYLAHYGMLAGWSTRLIGDPDLGHDVATETFLRLLRHWGEVNEPRSWLYATAANIIRDHWRKRGREHAAYQRVGLTEDVAQPQDVVTHLTVREAVLTLPDRLRVPVMLHYFADLTVAQVATQMGKSEGTIKRDLWDARGRLATLLEDAR
ncbi:putative RNA polymerase ECF-subfamily sigma factor [Nostocoides japonicum T1-X7]|uniref:Putative RNA polymerase ECF-subfamily sigma factor n=1 Tax=Nostocoides japonicum T1-X7 TaxID=1194083 RepID=A0A077LUV7_9MICO|nr:RNA polymerase sigma factor [Tetrasphaera japonica]CCH77396.1 putative RNA polymerase ECF-subfamily sigma factor [Tetrasphaera japonica T1-X7]